MDEMDRKIIRRMQSGLSDSPIPYADAASELGLDTDELIRRLEEMRRSGVLRGVRAVLDQRKLGIEGNVLVAWDVPEERVDELGERFSSRSEVSHCVLRTGTSGWPYNLYTMIHAGGSKRAAAVVTEMAEAVGVVRYVQLETVRELKKTPPRYL